MKSNVILEYQTEYTYLHVRAPFNTFSVIIMFTPFPCHGISIFLLLIWTGILCYWTLWNSENLSWSSPAPPFETCSYSSRLELEDVEGLVEDDPKLIQFVEQYRVYPPSSREYRYSQLYEWRLMYVNESRYTTGIIMSYLRNKTNGVFVEAGANNGADELSNTLVLERDYNWTGLLVEGSPLVFPRLLAAHRKSWKSDVLLSKSKQSKLVIFEQTWNVYAGRESPLKESSSQQNILPVQVLASDGKTPLYNFEVLSVPLYSLIRACKFETIDYLSLDVEGNEVEILKNFPFDKILIRTMLVEVTLLGAIQRKDLTAFLSSKGFHKHPVEPTKRDFIFVHDSVWRN